MIFLLENTIAGNTQVKNGQEKPLRAASFYLSNSFYICEKTEKFLSDAFFTILIRERRITTLTTLHPPGTAENCCPAPVHATPQSRA